MFKATVWSNYTPHSSQWYMKMAINTLMTFSADLPFQERYGNSLSSCGVEILRLWNHFSSLPLSSYEIFSYIKLRPFSSVHTPSHFTHFSKTMTAEDIDPHPSHPEADVDDVSSSRTVIGKPPNHWLHSPSPPTFDLTRPSPPKFTIPYPDASIRLPTNTSDVLLSPSLTALVIIDMQNFFLSTCLGRAANGAGNRAGRRLLDGAIPAARKAGIRIIWLNWGLTENDIDAMPPSTRRAFGFESTLKKDSTKEATLTIDAYGPSRVDADGTREADRKAAEAKDVTENGKPKRIYKGRCKHGPMCRRKPAGRLYKRMGLHLVE